MDPEVPAWFDQMLLQEEQGLDPFATDAQGAPTSGLPPGYMAGNTPSQGSGSGGGYSNSDSSGMSLGQSGGYSVGDSQGGSLGESYGQSGGQSLGQSYGSSLGHGESQQSTGMVGGMLDVYNQLLGLNQGNYQQMLNAYTGGAQNQASQLPGIYGGYAGLQGDVGNTLGMGQVLGQNGNWGIAAPAAQAIAQSAARARGQTTQQMTNAGLGNTTLVGNMQNQNALREEQAYGELGANLAKTYAGYQSQQGLAGLASQMQGLGMQSQMAQAMGGTLGGYRYANTAGGLTGGFGSSQSDNSSQNAAQNAAWNAAFNQAMNQAYNQSHQQAQNAAWNASQNQSHANSQNWWQNTSQGPTQITIDPTFNNTGGGGRTDPVVDQGGAGTTRPPPSGGTPPGSSTGGPGGIGSGGTGGGAPPYTTPPGGDNGGGQWIVGPGGFPIWITLPPGVGNPGNINPDTGLPYPVLQPPGGTPPIEGDGGDDFDWLNPDGYPDVPGAPGYSGDPGMTEPGWFTPGYPSYPSASYPQPGGGSTTINPGGGGVAGGPVGINPGGAMPMPGGGAKVPGYQYPQGIDGIIPPKYVTPSTGLTTFTD